MRKLIVPTLVLAIAAVLAVLSVPYVGIGNEPEIAHVRDLTPSVMDTYCNSAEDLAATTGSDDVAIECPQAQTALSAGDIAGCQQELKAVSSFLAEHSLSAPTPDWVFDQACKPTNIIVIRDARPSPRITGHPWPLLSHITTHFSYQVNHVYSMAKTVV